MQETIHHWYWNVDIETNIYSLFVLTIPESEEYASRLHNRRLPYYTHSFFSTDQNKWYVKTQPALSPMMRVVHQGFLYGIYHNLITDFEWLLDIPVNGESQLVKSVVALCHTDPSIERVHPSIDQDNEGLWYPEDLGQFIRTAPDEQFQSWMRYIINGGDNNGSKNKI